MTLPLRIGIQSYHHLHISYYFFGDPVRMSMAAFTNHDRTAYMEKARAFLKRTVEEADM
ncbi:MAG: hypothetical protein AAF629_13455 [Chloroflexota bacterium]